MTIPLHSEVSHAELEKRARRFWTAGIVGLLSLQICVGGAALYLANSDPTVAIIPDYYHKAVNWDATRRSMKLTQQLGWQIDVSVGDAAQGARTISLSLSSDTSHPIDNQRVTAEVYHHACGDEVFELSFLEAGDGRYWAECPLVQAGLWQVTFQIEGDSGIASESLQVRVD